MTYDDVAHLWLAALIAGLALVLTGCSSTTTGHSGLVSLDESRAETKEGADVPRISFAISFNFREKPTKGAVNNLITGITDRLPSHAKEAISPWGAAGQSLSLTPASVMSEIESGRRGQIFIPFYIDNPRGEDQKVEIVLKDLRAAAKKALAEEGVPPGKLDGIIAEKVKIKIKTTEVSSVKEKKDEKEDGDE